MGKLAYRAMPEDAASLKGTVQLGQTASLLGNFVTSGAGITVATSITHPIDVVKVHQQMQSVGQKAGSDGMLRTASSLLRSEAGPSSLFRGIEPAVFRAMSYGCLRLGMYEPTKHAISDSMDKAYAIWSPSQVLREEEGQKRRQSNLGEKLAAGIVAGSVATALTNPMDVVKVRMQLGGSSSGSMTGLMREVARKEGVGALWKGVGPSMGRASALTAAQCAVYDECKQTIKAHTPMKEGVALQLGASMLAGVISTAASSPFDTVKTRMMAQRTSPSPSAAAVGEGAAASTQQLYRSSMQCAYHVLKTEGVKGLYKGWTANYARLGPQTAITFLVYEKLRQLLGMSSL